MTIEVLKTSLGEHLPLLASGKVREIYSLSDRELLFVTTDRISAYDVVMRNAIANKGAVLTMLSKFWFDLLEAEIPSLHTHFISLGPPPSLQSSLDPSTLSQLQRRCMIVRRLKVFPIESIVRGYLSGSAWSSYQRDGTVHGMQLPSGFQESQKLPEPLWTPSTKAASGDKDENISPAQAENLVGKQHADEISKLSLDVYKKASQYAAKRGIIIADTKFEFALDESPKPPAVVLVDEVLTPDSSRFWDAEDYQAGRAQDSLDKQFLRDWLVQTGQKGKEEVEVPQNIRNKTSEKYKIVFERLTGHAFEVPAA